MLQWNILECKYVLQSLITWGRFQLHTILIFQLCRGRALSIVPLKVSSPRHHSSPLGAHLEAGSAVQHLVVGRHFWCLLHLCGLWV